MARVAARAWMTRRRRPGRGTRHGSPPDAPDRRWLRDPRAVKPTTAMPNLDLSDGEIADLIAFLNARP